MQTDNKRTWTIDGKTVHEDQVKVVELDWYVCDELLSPLCDLFTMMADYDQSSTGTTGIAGRTGEVMVDHARERAASFFSMLRQTIGEIELIVATTKTPGFPHGTLLAIEVRKERDQDNLATKTEG